VRLLGFSFGVKVPDTWAPEFCVPPRYSLRRCLFFQKWNAGPSVLDRIYWEVKRVLRETRFPTWKRTLVRTLVAKLLNAENHTTLNPLTPRVSYGDIKVVLTSESVDEILWCDHSNKTSLAVLSQGTIYILSILQNEIWDSFLILIEAGSLVYRCTSQTSLKAYTKQNWLPLFSCPIAQMLKKTSYTC